MVIFMKTKISMMKMMMMMMMMMMKMMTIMMMMTRILIDTMLQTSFRIEKQLCGQI